MLRVETDGPVTTIIRSRSEARNAMDPESADALVDALKAFDRDPASSVCVLYGEGGAFCSGWDLKYVSTIRDADRPLPELDFPKGGGDAPRGPLGPTRLELDKPVIAAVAGPAVAGGMELAMWCDIRVMEETAYMGVYCRRWGVPLIDGGTVRMPRIIGRGRALDIILTGRKVPAQECYEIGLCERLVPEGQSRQAAEALAHEIARFPQECVRADRRSVYLQHDKSVRAALETEWENGQKALRVDGVAGAGRFRDGKGRHGDFKDI